MTEKHLAIEIKTQEIADLITTIAPTFKECDYEDDLHGNFFMIGFPKPGQFAVIPPSSIKENWDHITPFDPKIPFRHIIR